MGNSNMHAAKKAKDDEFYTQLSDIENELKHYKAQFRDKVVYLNCDDAEWSNFWLYFKLNFNHLGLKKLISTHYCDNSPSYKLVIDRDLDLNGDGVVNEKDLQKIVLITYKETFPLIKDNKMWAGTGFNLSMVYKSPYGNNLEGNRKYVTNKGYDPDTHIKVPAIAWFTNMEHNKRNQPIILYKNYTAEEYPKYDNYDVINIDKVKEIPVDYDGVMGVPITFLGSYNPNQFDILGIANSARWIGYKCITIIDGRKVYNRILIKKK